MRIAREYETPLLLGLLCALLALVVAAEWLGKTAYQRSVRAQLAGGGRGAAIGAEDAGRGSFSLPPLEKFNVIAERPLFQQGRRPLSPDVQVEPEKPLEVQLHGIVAGPDGMLALLKDKTGHHHKLRQEEKLDGWTLTEIRDDRVIFVRDDARQELLLQKPKPKEAAKTEGQKPSPDQGQRTPIRRKKTDGSEE